MNLSVANKSFDLQTHSQKYIFNEICYWLDELHTKSIGIQGHDIFFSFQCWSQKSNSFWNWGRLYFNFSDFTNFTYIFFCFFSQIVANFAKNDGTRNLLSAMFLFSSFRELRKLTVRCGAKITPNEKWLPFGGRCFHSESWSIFKFSEINWIM